MHGMAISHVIFDVDGTLIDSAPGIIAGYREVFHHFDREPPSEEVLRRDIGPSLHTIMERHGLGDADPNAATELYRSYYQEHGIHQASVYPGISEALTMLDGAGVVMATATQKRTSNAVAILEAHGLAGFFEVIGGAEDSRPDKASIAAYSLHELGANPQHTALVGDRRYDIEAAIQLRLGSIGATWGYGTIEELTDARAGHIVESPARMLDVLITSRLAS